MLSADTVILQDRFRIVRTLGSGGMGEVYLGVEVATGRKVAIKALHRDLHQQPGMLERFRREAQLLSAVEHPSVVRVVEFGNSEGTAYLVMEYVEGESLHTLLHSGGLSTPRALNLLAQLAEGLGAIHERGIVHRDLKPENVILSQAGAQGEQARLLDFGIARLAEPEPTSQVSQVGLVIGTPEYLSPEQAMGGKVDARSDLYSFGVLAYQVLSGHLPFAGPGPRHFLLQHVGTPPTPLEQSAPRLAAHPLLVSTVMRLLEKDPTLRFPSAGAVAGALREALATLPTQLATGSWTGVAKLTGSPGTAVYGSAALKRGGTQTFGVAPAASPAPSATPTVQAAPALPLMAQLPRPRTARRWALLACAAALAAGSYGIVRSRRPDVRARVLLESQEPAEALRVLDAAEPTPTLAVLRAAALHALGDHAQEHARVAAFRPEERAALEDRLVENLASDFGASEEEPRVRAALGVFSPGALLPRMEKLAKHGQASPKQWGALRYLEAQQHTESLELVQLYSAALGMPDCAVRARAASRLGALGDRDAVKALERLTRAAPTGGDCGQREAADALRRLR